MDPLSAVPQPSGVPTVPCLHVTQVSALVRQAGGGFAVGSVYCSATRYEDGVYEGNSQLGVRFGKCLGRICAV